MLQSFALSPIKFWSSWGSQMDIPAAWRPRASPEPGTTQGNTKQDVTVLGGPSPCSHVGWGTLRTGSSAGTFPWECRTWAFPFTRRSVLHHERGQTPTQVPRMVMRSPSLEILKTHLEEPWAAYPTGWASGWRLGQVLPEVLQPEQPGNQTWVVLLITE